MNKKEEEGFFEVGVFGDDDEGFKVEVFGIELRVSFKVMGTSRTITYCCNNCHVCFTLDGVFFSVFWFLHLGGVFFFTSSFFLFIFFS